MQRNTETVRADKNIDVGLNQGHALLVQLTGSSFTGNVDFQSSVDGSTFSNTPYIQQASVTAAKSVAQIADPSTATVYIILPPVSQVRVKVSSLSAGSLEVVYREVEYSRPFDGAADDEKVSFGGVAFMQWQTDDANANVLALLLPTGGAVDVPVFVIGDPTAEKDLGWYNGVTEPQYAVVDADGDSAVGLGFNADDDARIILKGSAVLTMPAQTWGGTVTGGSQSINDLGGLDLDNNVYITARNQADGANISMWKVNTSDRLEPGANVETMTIQDYLALPTATELTIASGAITVTQFFHGVDTEANASSDNLDTINGGTAQQLLFLKSQTSRDVVIRDLNDSGGNINVDGAGTSVTLAEGNTDIVILWFNGTNWTVLASNRLF